jgi:hypothetical protein
MKNKIVYVLALSGALLFAASSCRKETTAGVSKVVTVSYPKITLNGDPAISIPVGGSVADPGAKVFDDVTNTTTDIMASSNNINANTPGLYFLIYTATNANGFESSVVRPVAVTDISPSVDMTGTYARTSNGIEAHVTKVGTGLFLNDNVGGVPPPSPAVLPVYMVLVNDSTLLVPEQPVPNNYGTLSAKDATVSLVPGDSSYSYIVLNPGFGTARRTFVKQ